MVRQLKERVLIKIKQCMKTDQRKIIGSISIGSEAPGGHKKRMV